MAEKGIPQWYIVQVMSGQENRVKESLVVRRDKMKANDEDCGLDEVLVPITKIEERRNRKVYVKEVKSFPGYVFVRARIFDDDMRVIPDHWLFIKDTKGVINFLGGETPVPLSEEEIGKIMQDEREADVPKVRKVWKVGDSVVIKDGTFENFLGVVESVDEDKQRLKVSVTIFGRQTPFECDFWQVDVPEEPRN